MVFSAPTPLLHGSVVINGSHVFVKIPTNRNTHVFVTKFPDFSWPPGAMEFCRDPATLSKLEWKYTEKCSVVIVTQFSPPTVGSWTLQIIDSGAPLLTPLEIRELTPMVRQFKHSLSVGPSHSSD